MRNLTNLQATVIKMAQDCPAAGSIQSLRKFSTHIAAKFKFLGKGVFRSVYKALDDEGQPVVIKIVNFRNHSECYSDSDVYQGNQMEWDAYCNIKDNMPELLPCVLPPLACWKVEGHCVLIYPYVDVIECHSPMTYNAIREANKEEFDTQYEDLHAFFDDVHDENVGIYEGRPVMIDYNFGTC